MQGRNLCSAARLGQINVGLQQKPGKSSCTTKGLLNSCSSAVVFWYDYTIARERRPVALNTSSMPKSSCQSRQHSQCLALCGRRQMTSLCSARYPAQTLCLYGIIHTHSHSAIEGRGNSPPCASLLRTPEETDMDMSTSAVVTDASHSSRSTHDTMQGQHGELYDCLLTDFVPTLPRHRCTRRCLGNAKIWTFRSSCTPFHHKIS